MKKREPRKPFTGYYQRREWRRRHRRRRTFRLTKFVALGVILGAVAGSFVSDQNLRNRTAADFAELWEQYKPSTRRNQPSAQIPEQLLQHYRPAPNSGVATPERPRTASKRHDVASVTQFDICSSPIRVNCVVDGDTIWFRGVKIRIADIDTPEISRPKCASEEALGQRAKHRLLALLNAGPIQVVHSSGPDVDRYGRKLRVIERDGRSLGDILIAEGLARRWDGARRSWC